MAISNINITNPPASVVNRSVIPIVTHTVHKESTKEDNSNSTEVSISTHARDLHRSEAAQTASQEHAERIRAINQSDEAAQEKLQATARVEARALAAKQNADAESYKRIDTHA